MPLRAIVTGASAGIGRETTLALASAGLEVIAVARRSAELATLAAHGTICPVTADITQPEGVARVVAAIGHTPVAMLVHGAGVFPRGRLDDLTPPDWDAAWSANVSSRIHLVQVLRPLLSGGRVLFIGSDAARTPRAGGAAYSVTQAASEMLWRCCATEWGETIAFGLAKPGLVATAMLNASLSAPRERFPAGAVYAAMLERGETITAHTVARFFRFLLQETSRDEFTRDPWDSRETAHHPRWLDGPLYRPPIRQE